MRLTFENGVLLMRLGASVVLHHSLPLMNSFNKTEAAVFSCRLCFLRAFPSISLIKSRIKKCYPFSWEIPFSRKEISLFAKRALFGVLIHRAYHFLISNIVKMHPSLVDLFGSRHYNKIIQSCFGGGDHLIARYEWYKGFVKLRKNLRKTGASFSYWNGQLS